MNEKQPLITPPRRQRSAAGKKLRDADKVELIPVKVDTSENLLRKPSWIRIKASKTPKAVQAIKNILRTKKLASVCEEANCPNLTECFSKGTATFMIMGEICTRRCPFCDVAHGKPLALDSKEPLHLAEAISEMNLKYVVITSVDRDDLVDGGAQHFVDCVTEINKLTPTTKIEVLTPDFKGRMAIALDIMAKSNLDVFNHNLETVPEIYRKVRPGATYEHSLQLLQKFKARRPDILTKSGLMVGLGETTQQLLQVFRDLRSHNVDMLTVGQYLQPSKHHLAVQKYYHPDEFALLQQQAQAMGFKHIASGPLVRSSYHADSQADGSFEEIFANS